MLEVVCGVISDDMGRILACRRSLGRHLGGLWEFPGGKVDAGETHGEALRRELVEELGVVVSVGEKLGDPVEWTDGDVSIRLNAYSCLVLEGEPCAFEHDEIRWYDVHELAELEWAEADIPILVEIQNGFPGRV